MIVEIKAAANICIEHEAELTNYLRATEIQVELLLILGKLLLTKEKFFLLHRSDLTKKSAFYNYED